MERRKIIVNGCSNCPYLTIWNDGSGKGFDSISTGSCDHPSFNKELDKPHFSKDVIIGEASVKATNFADFCPLPNE